MDGEHGGNDHGLLEVRLLGGFTLTLDGADVTRGLQRRPAKLIKLLALAPGRRMHREHVVETLWPDADFASALNNLHKCLHSARQALQGHRDRLAFRDSHVALLPPVQIDVDDFTLAAKTARQTKLPSDYHRALSLYSGELLPDDRFDEWAAQRREHLHSLAIDLHHELAARHEELGDREAAVDTWTSAIALEPALEEAYRHVMRLHAASARPHKVAEWYRRLCVVLEREFGGEPDDETKRMHEQARVLARERPAEPTEKNASGSSRASGAGAFPHLRPAHPPFGRAAETQQVLSLWHHSRLLTLRGAIGVGKSTLARDVARHLTNETNDGVVVWIDFAETDARSVEELVARLPAGSPEGRVVLDNADAAPAVARQLVRVLMEQLPACRVMVTSRAPLHPPGEVVWRVPPLPSTDAPLRADSGDASATGLFLQRIQEVQPRFRLNPDTQPAFSAALRAADGLPLALELLALRLRALSIEQVARKLEDLPHLLRTDAPHVPERQRSFDAQVARALEDLSSAETRLLFELSARRRPLALEAIEEHHTRYSDVLDALGGLTERSLVLVERPGGAMRYRVLEPIRQCVVKRMREAKSSEREANPARDEAQDHPWRSGPAP